LILGSVALIVIALSRVSLHLGYFQEDREQATAAIAQFHQRIEDGRFGEVYNDADEKLQTAAPREVLIEGMQKTRDVWGRLSEVTYLQTKVVVGPEVQISALCNVTFERGEATELFIFIRRNKKVKLAHYEIHEGKFRPEA
jgi:hypothetical protein